MRSGNILRTLGALLLLTLPGGCRQTMSAGDRMLALLDDEKPVHVVDEVLFAELGWDLPDSGTTVKRLADAAPGGAFDPRALEAIPSQTLGYQASWHEIRFDVYGLHWDIGALLLEPERPIGGLPTMVIVNGGAANWYEFFVDPLNGPGLGQYLSQRVPVLLVTIPGNYRHGGWAGSDFGARIPAYLLDRDIGAEEAAIRNAVYTFRVVAEGVARCVEEIVAGPAVIVGHSTGGEIQFLLMQRLGDKLRGLSLGWGTGGPAGLDAMQEFRGERSIDDYPHVSRLRARTPGQYAGGYLGPLNPLWDPELSRAANAEAWMAREQRRRPQFKQPLQDYEHQGAVSLAPEIASQVRETLAGNPWGVDAGSVIADLFSTMHAPLTGYRKMLWTTAALDDGHWNEDPAAARELLVANEFRRKNPGVPIRVLLFDVPMTHYGHIEKPRQLAGGLIAALTWLNAP